jgi:hypothetical protein
MIIVVHKLHQWKKIVDGITVLTFGTVVTHGATQSNIALGS